MKAIFSKLWAWIVGHKIIAISVASVIVVGSTCGIVLPIALHEHSYKTEWSTDAQNHWHDAECKHEEKSDLGAHSYDNACDTACNVCGYERTVGAHVYDDDCDTTCNVCGATRTVGAHVYDNDCDTTCNECGAERTITHDHATTLTAGETTHWYECSVCGDKKDETAHVFDKTVVSSEYLKEAATATTKAQYYKSCVCGAKSATEYFETDKAPANLQVFDISKTYDGTPVAEPTVTFDGVGAENFAYYKGDERLTERPTDAGTYKVVVTVDETDTHAGERVEREFTIAKKVLSNVEASVVYDGSTTFGEVTLAHDGIVVGDVIIVDIDVTNKNVGVYTGTDAVFAILDVLGNGATNYVIDEQTTEVAVTKRTIWTTGAKFAYDGYHFFSGEESVDSGDIVFHGLVNGETIANDFVEWMFDGNSVDSPLIQVEFIDEDDGRSNYTFDVSKCSANIVPKVLTNISLGNTTYKGSTEFEFALSPLHGLVSGENFLLHVTTASKDVGNAVEIASISYNNSNYKIDKSEITLNIVARILDNVVLTVEYSGESWWDVSYTNAENSDIVSGDTLVLEISGTEKTVGEYTIGNGKLEEIVTGTLNYNINMETARVTVTPKTINVTAEFEYSGFSVRQIHAPAPSLSDVIDGDEVYVEIAFDKADVDATVLTGEDAPYLDGEDAGNYVLGENCRFSIVPKKLTLKAGEKIETTETYNGHNQHTLSVSSNQFDGYVDTEAAQLWLTATLPSKNVGEYTDGVILTPYVGNQAFGTVSHNYDFSEVEATVTVNRLGVSLSSYVKVEYNGTSEFTLDTPFDLTSANTGGGQDSVSDLDEVYITWIKTYSAHITDETFAMDYTLGGADACNYYIDELGVEITPKKLTKLNIKITAATANSLVVTLLPKDGVIPGEVVKIKLPGLDKNQDFYNYTEIEMLIDEDAVRQGQEYVTLLKEGDYANYELATYDNNGVQMVGIISCVDECDVQYDGTCNCGSSHITETLTFAGGEDVGKSATIACDSTYEGGIYKIALEGGEYEFSGSDDFFNISGIYDVNGNKIADRIGTYILPQGTYYFHVYVGSSPYSDTIWVKKTAKILDAATMANAIVPDMEPGNSDVGVRIHNLQTHNGGDTFVLFYNVGENIDALGHEINFRYEDGDGGYSATSNIESIEFYDVNGIQLNVTYDEPDMLAASGVTAVGGVYIVVTMNGEGMDNLYFYAF